MDKRIPLREFAEVNSQKWATAIIRTRRFELFYYMLTTGERIETPYTLALAAIALSFSFFLFPSFLPSHHSVKIGSFTPFCSSSRCIKTKAASASLMSPASLNLDHITLSVKLTDQFRWCASS